MEAGAAFLLLLIVIAFGIVGAGIWAIMSTLRRRKLNPHEDKIDSVMEQTGALHEDRPEPRPTHRRVSSEQQIRSIPRR